MDVYQISLTAINQATEQLTTVSHNVANLNTPGYLATETFHQQLTAANGMAHSTQQLVDLSQSEIKTTARALDVAINDDSLFQIQLGQQTLLSRHGKFYLDQQQFLRHVSGGYVMGVNGKIQLPSQPVTIEANGTVLAAGDPVAQIATVRLTQAAQLSAVGDGLYQSPSSNQMVSQANLTPNALNSSNVDAAAQMIKMIELSRYLQTEQKVVNAYDGLLQIGINELGKK